MEPILLDKYISVNYNGDKKFFARKQGLKLRKVNYMINHGTHHVISDYVVEVLTKIKPHSNLELFSGTIADRFYKSMNKKSTDKELEEEVLIEMSISCERFGPDDLRYTFSDYSSILYRSVVDKWEL